MTLLLVTDKMKETYVENLLSKNEEIRLIFQKETDQLLKATIDHFAIPLILGMSMDHITQKQYEELGGKGPKPEPLSNVGKLRIYNAIKAFFKPILQPEAVKLLKIDLILKLKSLSQEALKQKAEDLKKSVNFDSGPDWSKFGELLKDHLFLFKEWQQNSNAKLDPKKIDDKFCPIMSKYRDSGELFKLAIFKEKV